MLSLPGFVPGKVIVRKPNRHATYFTKHITEGWTADSDTKIVLTEEGSGSNTKWVVTDSNGRIETFDAGGRIESIEYRNRSLSYTYASNPNGSGQSVTVMDDFGKTMVAIFDGRWLLSATDPAGNTYSFDYNDIGQLSTIYFPDTTPKTLDDNPNRQFHYEETLYPESLSKYLLSAITDERGVRYVDWGYSSGKYPRYRATSSRLAGEGSYNVSNNVGGAVTITNPLGKEAVYQYSLVSGAKKITSIIGNASEYCVGTQKTIGYDSSGFISEVVNNNGHLTSYERDDLGRVTAKVEASGTAIARATLTEWHPTWSRPSLVTEPGTTTAFSFDANGNVLTKTVTDNLSGLQRITHFSYNQYGQVLSVDGPLPGTSDVSQITYYDCDTGNECGQRHTVSNALGHTTTYASYDGHGNPLVIVDANGVETIFTYDLRQRITSITTDGAQTSYAYDATGNLTAINYPDGSQLGLEWNPANRLTQVVDAQGNRIEWDYDPAGNRIATRYKDDAGVLRKTQSQVFDKLSRLLQVIGADNQVEQFGYDKNNNRTERLDALGHRTSSIYDQLDRLITITDAMDGVTHYSYDGQDNITSVTDPKGLTTSYTYNGFGDILSSSSPDTGTTTFTVDIAGNRLSKTDARGIQTYYSYDALHRITQASFPDSAENINYVYDEGNNGIGRLSRIEDESGQTHFHYDARGNTTSIVQIINGITYSTQYTYNNADRLTGITYPSGRELTFSLDANGQVQQVNSLYDGQNEMIVSNIRYLPFGPVSELAIGNGIVRTRQYDLDYRVTSISDGSSLSRNYAYNPVHNVTAITDALAPDSSQIFAYDALERLTIASGGYGDKDYSYDAIGNRLSLSTTTDSGTHTQSYQYDSGSHRLQSIIGEQQFQYDAIGNTTGKGGASFSFNDRNRMVSSTASGTTSTYQYNGMGQRVRKIAPTKETHYIYDLEGRLIAEGSVDGTTAVEYAYVAAEPLAMWVVDEAATAPSTVTPLSPLGDITIPSPAFEWEDLGNVTVYWLRVYDRTVKEWVHDVKHTSTDICNNGICSITPPDLNMPFSNNHLWRIRAKNSAGWNDWSENHVFNRVDTIPGLITPLAPLGTIAIPSPAFEWEDLGNVTVYWLRVYDRTVKEWVHDVKHTSTDICNNGICSITPPDLNMPFSNNHLWRIRAKNSAGWNDWSENHVFNRVDTIPGLITPLAPLGTIAIPSPAFEWKDLGNVTVYWLRVYDRTVKEWVHDVKHSATDICNNGICSITPPDLNMPFSNNHLWRIRAKNSAGWNDWSENHVFNHVDTIPGIITPLAPLGEITTQTPAFKWEDVGNATDYRLRVYDRILATWVHDGVYAAADICNGSTCSITPNGLRLSVSNNSDHLWRVRAKNSGGWNDWTSNQRFNVVGGQ